VSAIEQYMVQKQDNLTESIEDQREFLRRYYDSSEKINPHNLGMV